MPRFVTHSCRRIGGWTASRPPRSPPCRASSTRRWSRWHRRRRSPPRCRSVHAVRGCFGNCWGWGRGRRTRPCSRTASQSGTQQTGVAANQTDVNGWAGWLVGLFVAQVHDQFFSHSPKKLPTCSCSAGEVWVLPTLEILLTRTCYLASNVEEINSILR